MYIKTWAEPTDGMAFQTYVRNSTDSCSFSKFMHIFVFLVDKVHSYVCLYFTHTHILLVQIY